MQRMGREKIGGDADMYDTKVRAVPRSGTGAERNKRSKTHRSNPRHLLGGRCDPLVKHTKEQKMDRQERTR